MFQKIGLVFVIRFALAATWFNISPSALPLKRNVSVSS